MKNNNLKKFLPGLVSIVIIAGMAIQSFATNVDMAAFVKKDKYMTKYYELDWRIDDIERSLEKLYKYVCTNVKTFGGSYSSGLNIEDTVTTYTLNAGQTYNWYSCPVVDLSEEGYLRFNYMDAINAFGNHSKTDRYEFEIPASLLKWRNDIELYPNTKIKYITTRTVPNTTSAGATISWNMEFIMGPFKKIPRMTGTSYDAALASSNGYFIGSPNWDFANVYYSYNKDTQPTSWTQMTGSQHLYLAQVDANNSSSYPAEIKRGIITREEIEDASFSKGYRNIRDLMTVIRPYNATWVDLSSYDKVWIRATGTGSGVNTFREAAFTLTTWNYNK